jgi:4-amino-4-deoxy-L-arabinose transferase-like glycosyltransferase
LDRIFAAPAARHLGDLRLRRWAWVWFALALALNLLGNGSYALFDRDEPRYAEATREMIAGGDWIVPTFNHELRPDKPVLIYWLMSVPMTLWGPTTFAARLVASLSGAAVVALVWLLALRLAWGAAGAALASLILMISMLPLLLSKAATTDAFLTLTVLIALYTYWRQRTDDFTWARHAIFWVAIAASVLVKGPPGPLVVGLAIGCERAWRRLAARRVPAAEPDRGPPIVGGPGFLLRTATGLAIVLALTLPWAMAVHRRTEGEFFKAAVGIHVIDRARQPQEGHGGPAIYYLAVLPLLVFPTTALVLVALRWAWLRRADPRVRWLWSWLVPFLVVLSLIDTKLPHYPAPLLPALALMAGGWWSEYRRAPQTRATLAGPNWWRAGAVLMGGIGVLAGIAPAALALHFDLRPLLAPAFALGAPMIGAMLWGASFWWRRRPASALAAWFGGQALFVAGLCVWALPACQPLRAAPAIAGWIDAHAPVGADLIAVQYQEPSLVFYCRRGIDMEGKNSGREVLARMAAARTPIALIIPSSRWNRWLDELGAPPPAIRVLHRGRYLMLNGDDPDELLIVGNWSAPLN